MENLSFINTVEYLFTKPTTILSVYITFATLHPNIPSLTAIIHF